MDSSGTLLYGMLLLSFLSVLCHGQGPAEVTIDEDFEADPPSAVANRDLVEALEVLLGRTSSQVPSMEKRGSIPLCGIGDRCAVRRGPRIGMLCDCGRGTNCNSYLLKCI